MYHLGLTVMLAASLISMVELSEREGRRVAAILQPNFAYATEPFEPVGHDEQMNRRGKEEIAHPSTSYGTARRSHSNTGTL